MEATVAGSSKRDPNEGETVRLLVSCFLHPADVRALQISCRRNLVNILLYLAEMCRRYFPAEEISEMLSTFIPLVTSEVCHNRASDVYWRLTNDLPVVPGYDPGHNIVYATRSVSSLHACPFQFLGGV